MCGSQPARASKPRYRAAVTFGPPALLLLGLQLAVLRLRRHLVHVEARHSSAVRRPPKQQPVSMPQHDTPVSAWSTRGLSSDVQAWPYTTETGPFQSSAQYRLPGGCATLFFLNGTNIRRCRPSARAARGPRAARRGSAPARSRRAPLPSRCPVEAHRQAAQPLHVGFTQRRVLRCARAAQRAHGVPLLRIVGLPLQVLAPAQVLLLVVAEDHLGAEFARQAHALPGRARGP